MISLDEIEIRSETIEDFAAITAVHQAAFAQLDEARLVEQLRQLANFQSQLSFVATHQGQVIAHLLFTDLMVESDHPLHLSALAPIAVLPDYQNQGIGKKLIRYGLSIMKFMEYDGIILIGDPSYYRQFGFKHQGLEHIHCAYQSDYFLGVIWSEDAIASCRSITYPEPFKQFE